MKRKLTLMTIMFLLVLLLGGIINSADAQWQTRQTRHNYDCL